MIAVKRIFERAEERVPHMQRASYIWRWHWDDIGRALVGFVGRSIEDAVALPEGVPALFHSGWFVGFVEVSFGSRGTHDAQCFVRELLFRWHHQCVALADHGLQKRTFSSVAASKPHASRVLPSDRHCELQRRRDRFTSGDRTGSDVAPCSQARRNFARRVCARERGLVHYSERTVSEGMPVR